MHMHTVLCAAHSTFRVSSATDSGRSHTLQASDELDKRHWLQCIDEAYTREVLSVATTAGAAAAASDTVKLCRHSSDASSNDTLSADFQSPVTSTSSREECHAVSATLLAEPVESCTDNAVKQLTPDTPTSHSRQVSKCIYEEL